jgi:phytoene dehydrogenase-like protein
LGQSKAGELPIGADRSQIEKWLKDYFALTTYEIACPVLRDPSLAPEKQTGLIISVLFDYKLTKIIEEMGWYDDFKKLAETSMIEVLNSTIYPGIKAGVITQFSSTPITIEKYSGNSDGAITGWALNNHPIPAESRIPKIMNSVATPIPHVYQAGQWTYSPSGLPISIITGKIAADKVIRDIKKK